MSFPSIPNGLFGIVAEVFKEFGVVHEVGRFRRWGEVGIGSHFLGGIDHCALHDCAFSSSDSFRTYSYVFPKELFGNNYSFPMTKY